MKDFTSPDGSFGFGGFDEQSMIQMLVPVMKEHEADITNEPYTTAIHALISATNPQFDLLGSDSVNANVICAILSIKKYGLAEALAVQMAAKQEVVEWCFTKYLEANGGNLDSLFPAETTVKIGEGLLDASISASEMSGEMKLLQMMPIVHETTEKVMRDEKYRYSAAKMLNKLKSHPKAGPTEAMFATILQVRYKRSFDEAFELAKEGKAIQVCYEEYLKEMGTSLVSDAMGESPSDSAH